MPQELTSENEQTLPGHVASTAGLGVLVAMRPMQFEDGRVGWYVDHPDFYCDIEPDEHGVWSVFFRDKDGKEAFAENRTDA